MEQLILWFNIISFTLLFGSLGVTFVLYGKYNPGWLYPYLLYLVTYAFFVIFLTYHFFSLVYLPHPYPVLDSFVVYMRFLIAVILLFIVPKFVISIIPGKVSSRYRFIYRVIPILFLFMFVSALLFNIRGADRMVTVFFNMYMGSFTFYGLYKLKSVKNKSSLGVVVPFLYLSCVLYFAVAIQAFILIFIPSLTWIDSLDIFTAGFICFLWSTVTLGFLFYRFIKQSGKKLESLPLEFINHYNISAREREIIILLSGGMSNREIGEKLYISPRTVETHVYNIYRKCSVRNKLELVRLISEESLK